MEEEPEKCQLLVLKMQEWPENKDQKWSLQAGKTYTPDTLIVQLNTVQNLYWIHKEL